MKIEAKTKIEPLLKNYPFLLDFLAGWSPKFEKLRHPVLRKTLGKVASLEQAAGLGGVPVDRLLEAIAGEVRRVTGEEIAYETGSGGDRGPAPLTDRAARKEVLKDIIRDLHDGGDMDELRTRFSELVKDVSGAEIGAMEQELIEEGLPESEVRRLCDVHVKIFEEGLEAQAAPQIPAGHPLHTLRQENQALARLIAETKEALAAIEAEAAAPSKKARFAALKPLVDRLFEVDKHFLKKENQLFPRLEAKGVSGPSKVMWGIHDDIRSHLKHFRRAVELEDRALVARTGNQALQEMSDMINKEEKILFPMSLEMLDDEDWSRVKEGEGEVGYAWIPPGEAAPPSAPGGGAGPAAARASGSGPGSVELDTGSLTPEQINLMLVHMPVDVSFVDESDTVVYYSATPERIFPRSPGVIGRKVQNCHPSKSLDTVNRILEAFKAGRRDEAEFWIEMAGKFIHIRYFALRDAGRRYRGCLEVSQDVTGIRALQGQKRLLDWED